MKNAATFPLILLILLIGGIGVLTSCTSDSDPQDDTPSSSSTDNPGSSSLGNGRSSSSVDKSSSSSAIRPSSSSNGGIGSNVGKCMIGEDMCFQHEDVDEMICSIYSGTYVNACPGNPKCSEIDEDGWEIFYYDENFCSEGAGEPIPACMMNIYGFEACFQGENIYKHECDALSGDVLNACPTDGIACSEEEDGTTTFYYNALFCQ